MIEVDVPAQNAPYLGKHGRAIQQGHQRIVFLDDVGHREQLTTLLGRTLAGIDAVDVITSLSRAEQSQISVRFRLEKDADNAAAEVRDRTSRVRNRLPDGVDEPVIAKVEADAVPVMWPAFSSDVSSSLLLNCRMRTA